MTKFSLLASAAAVAVVAFAGAAANANPISVGYSTDGGKTITTISSSDNLVAAATSVGNFTITMSATGQAGSAPTSLFSNTITVNSTGAGSIILYASEINNTSRSTTFSTGFASNSMSTVTVGESSYLGLSNSLYSVTSPYQLSSLANVPGAGTPVLTVNAPTLPALYSLTEAYAINFTAAGNLNATINVTSAVPEPVSLALLGTGLVGLGLIRRRNRA